MDLKHYEDPEMEVVLFDTADIITDSGIGDTDEDEGVERG